MTDESSVLEPDDHIEGIETVAGIGIRMPESLVIGVKPFILKRQLLV